jgi:hypothetical protein
MENFNLDFITGLGELFSSSSVIYLVEKNQNIPVLTINNNTLKKVFYDKFSQELIFKENFIINNVSKLSSLKFSLFNETELLLYLKFDNK